MPLSLLSDEQKNHTDAVIKKVLAQTAKFYTSPLPQFDNIKVSYTLNTTRILGRYCYRDGHQLELNPDLIIALGNKYDEIIIHEVCHALNRHLNGWGPNIKSHGREFKRLSHINGISGKATTSVANDYIKQHAKKKRSFHYHCACDTGHDLTIIRHNKILKGKVYKCNDCKTPIIYGKVGAPEPAPVSNTNYVKPKTKKASHFHYHCACDTGHNLTRIRHNRILRGITYKCKVCKTPIKYGKVVASAASA